MRNFFVQIGGYIALVLQGDPAVFDRWRWLAKHIKRGAIRTLDAGSGSGAFSIYAAKLGNDVLGISFDEPKNIKARERAELLGVTHVQFLQGDLRKLKSLTKDELPFDQIICFETIEHIKQDATLLKDFASILKPGGVLLLTTPYEHYRRLPGDGISETEDGGHVRWGYTHENFATLAQEAGFDIVCVGYISGFITRMLLLIERGMRKFMPASLARLILIPTRLLQFIDAQFTQLIKYPFLTITVVARKQNS